MQTCSKCFKQSPDSADRCSNCQSDLREFSTTAVALKQFQSNPRVRMVRINAAEDVCPACEALHGTYPKDEVPPLPHAGCSNQHGCRCFYEPVLDEIYP